MPGPRARARVPSGHEPASERIRTLRVVQERSVAEHEPGVTFHVVRPVAATAAVAAETRTCVRITVAPTNDQELDVTLLDEIAAGSSARIYRAEVRGADGPERILAVRFLAQKGSDPVQELSRIRQEARRLALLSHRNIARVEEIFEFERHPAVLMEHVEGMDLSLVADALRGANRRFPARAALEVGVAAAAALDAALRQIPPGQHEPLGMVHRDVTPASLVLTVDGEIKVMDFGIAPSSSTSRGTGTGMVRLGSWTYMAPERKEGAQADHASDIYSLGLLLLELLSPDPLPGLPISAPEHDAVLRAHVLGLGPLGMPNEAWTRALVDLLLQMTASVSSHRPTAEQIVEVLRQYADQAEGASLADLALNLVRGAPGRGRSSRSEGDRTGTRFHLAVGGAELPRAERAEAPPPIPPDPYVDDEPAPTLPGTPWAPHPTIAPPEDTYASIRTPSGLSAPRPLGPILVPGAPVPGHPSSASQPVRPAPVPVRAVPAPLPVARAPAPPPPVVSDAPRRRSPWIWIAAAFLVLVAFVLLAVAGAAIALVLLSNRASEPVVAHLTIRPGDPAIQWIEVQAGEARPKRARGTFTGEVPTGRCDLSVKVVGRGAVRGFLDVTAARLDLTCTPGKEGRVLCSGEGGQPRVELVP